MNQEPCRRGHVGERRWRTRSNRPSGGWWECRACTRERQNAAYAANPEHGRQRATDWKARNPEYVAQRRITHAEYHRQKSREWYQRNREVVIQKTRLRKLKYAQGDLTTAQWKNIIALAEGRCLACGSDEHPLTVDHVVPLSMGGTHSADNVQPLCGGCNRRKFTKTVDFRPPDWRTHTEE